MMKHMKDKNRSKPSIPGLHVSYMAPNDHALRMGAAAGCQRFNVCY